MVWSDPRQAGVAQWASGSQSARRDMCSPQNGVLRAIRLSEQVLLWSPCGSSYGSSPVPRGLRAEAAKTFPPMAVSTWDGMVNGDKTGDAGAPSPALATSFLLA